MANWNGEDFPNDPPDADWFSGESSEPDSSHPPQSGSSATQDLRRPQECSSQECPPQGAAPLQGVSAEETFRRLAELHRQMLEKQYNNDAFRSEMERMGVWIRSMDTHLAQLANVETLAEQHRALLNDMLTKAQGHRQLLLDDMGKHQKVIDDALKAMGNPLKKLDDLLEEQTRSFQTFSSVVNKIWWIFLSAALSGALIGDLVASFFHV
jgi:hypothetical protein